MITVADLIDRHSTSDPAADAATTAPNRDLRRSRRLDPPLAVAIGILVVAGLVIAIVACTQGPRQRSRPAAPTVKAVQEAAPRPAPISAPKDTAPTSAAKDAAPATRQSGRPVRTEVGGVPQRTHRRGDTAREVRGGGRADAREEASTPGPARSGKPAPVPAPATREPVRDDIGHDDQLSTPARTRKTSPPAARSEHAPRDRRGDNRHDGSGGLIPRL